MIKLRSNRIGAAALILATGWRLQYRTLRCAALCFDRVYVLGTKDSRPLARSSVCQAFHSFSPDEPTFSAASAQLVNELCMRWGIDCILPSDADTTHFVGKYRSEFAARSFPVPSADTFDLLNNKYAFTKLCQKLDVPTPETHLVANRAELLELLALVTFKPPIVVKPLDMWGSYGVHVLKTNDAQQSAARIGYEPILVQQYIDGVDVCAFFVCSKGVVQAAALYRPGPNALHYIRNDHLQDQCLRIIQHCEYDGVIGFDIRDNGRESYFLECNPRFWYNMDITMMAGLNFVEIGLNQACCECTTTLAGMSILRPSALLRTWPGLWFSAANEHAMISYYLSDIPMALLGAADKLMRTVGLAGRTVEDPQGRPVLHG